MEEKTKTRSVRYRCLGLRGPALRESRKKRESAHNHRAAAHAQASTPVRAHGHFGPAELWPATCLGYTR